MICPQISHPVLDKRAHCLYLGWSHTVLCRVCVCVACGVPRFCCMVLSQAVNDEWQGLSICPSTDHTFCIFYPKKTLALTNYCGNRNSSNISNSMPQTYKKLSQCINDTKFTAWQDIRQQRSTISCVQIANPVTALGSHTSLFLE